MTNLQLIVLLLAFSSSFFTSKTLQAADTLYVDTVLKGLGDGSDWDNATNDLQAALGAASGGDMVVVKEGTYFPGTVRTDYFELESGVRLRGSCPSWLTGTAVAPFDPVFFPSILSGDIGTLGDSTDNSYTILYANNPTAATVLEGFVIEKANADAAGSLGINNRGGGLYVQGTCSINVFQCIFRNNHARLRGGAISMNGVNTNSSPEVNGCQFFDNTTGDLGGAIEFNGSFGSMWTEVQGCLFENNKGLAGAWGGGAVFVFAFDGASHGLFNGCIFNNNSIPVYGGGLMVYATNGGTSDAQFTNCLFNGNSTGFAGGGLHVASWNGANCTNALSGCTFTNNHSDYGGAINFEGHGSTNNPTLTNCMFTENSANVSGGGVNASTHSTNGGTCNASFSNCHFTDNDGGSTAGAIYNGGHSGTCSPVIDSCFFTGNFATTEAGAIQNAGDGASGVTNPQITNCVFSKNHCGTYGGAINNRPRNGGVSSPYIADCVFDSCYTTEPNSGKGSAIMNDGDGGMASPTIRRCLFRKNDAQAQGGAICNFGYNGGVASPLIVNNIFDGNVADNGGLGSGGASYGWGGAMFNWGQASGGCTPVITNNTFYNNQAREQGEAMRNFAFGNPIIQNNIFWGTGDSTMISNTAGAMPTVEYNDVAGGYPGTGNIDVDPFFINAAAGNFGLTNTSPCYGAGSNAAIPPMTPTDHAGNDRILGGSVDMGALESTFPQCTGLLAPMMATSGVSVDSTLIWAEVANATGYLLYAGTSPAFTNVLNAVDVGWDTTYAHPSGLPYDSTIYLTIVPYNASSTSFGCPEVFFKVDNCSTPRLYQWGGGTGLWSDWGAWSWDFVPYPCADVLIPTTDNVTLPNGKEGTGATLDVEGELTVEQGAVLTIGQ